MSTVHTHLMFQNGRAEEAMRRYVDIFHDGFSIDMIDRYGEQPPGSSGKVQLAVCTMFGTRLTIVDSPVQHGFSMTPAISLFVECDDNEQLEEYFSALGEGGETFMPLNDYGFSTRFGWLADQFGVSWQLNLR